MSSTIDTQITSSYYLNNFGEQNPLLVKTSGFVDVDSATAFTNGISGNGSYAWTITNLGTVFSFGNYGVAINFASGGVLTNGSAGVSSSYIYGTAVGVQLNGSAGNSGLVTNYGRIRVKSPNPFANAITANNIPATIVNTGYILGQNTSGRGANGIQLGSGGAVTNSGFIEGLSNGNSQNGIVAFAGFTSVVNSGQIYSPGSNGTAINLASASGEIDNNFGGIISGAGQGVAIGSGNITNAGSIEETDRNGQQAINLGNNGPSGLANSGTVASAAANGNGVLIGSGGAVITNSAAGVIAAYHTAIGFFPNGSATLAITNSGTIESTQSGAAAGSTFAINASGNSTTFIDNFGRISSAQTNGGGAVLLAGGQVVNEAGGVIAAASGIALNVNTAPLVLVNVGTIASPGANGIGVQLTPGSTFTNAGSVIGQTEAVHMGGSGSRLILDPGAYFKGSVNGGGGTLELAPGNGSAGAIRSLGSSVTNFSVLQFDAGAPWTVEGNSGGLPATILGFAAPDTIVVDGFVAATDTFTSNALVLGDGHGGQVTLNLQGDYVTADFAISTANGNTAVTVHPPHQSPAVLNDFGWAQGWGSPDNPRLLADVNADGASDYVGFGEEATFIAYGGTFSNGKANGPGFSGAVAAVNDFGTGEGYTAQVQRGAANAGVGKGDILYGQGFAGVYWYQATGSSQQTDAAGRHYNQLQYQSSPNFYGNFGSEEGWTPANGFQILKTTNSDSTASILGFGNDGIVVGPHAFAAGATAAQSYVISFGAGNNSGWNQQNDIRTFTDAGGNTIDLNHDGVADFVGMGPQGLEFAFGNDTGPGGRYQLGALTKANTGPVDLGGDQGWTDATTPRFVVADPATGFDDILAFGAAGVYVAMGQDPTAHSGQPFGQLYLAMADFGSDQGWSVAQTPRLVGDVNGDGIPDIVGFGSNSTFAALGSRDGSGNLHFAVDPARTIADFGSSEGWSGTNPQTVRALGQFPGSSQSDLVLSGAFNTQTWQFV